MNVQQLTNEVAKATHLSKADARNFLKATLGAIKTSVRKGERVVLNGFGTFEKTARKARKGRNPKTGEQIKIRATNYPKFRPGKSFKEAVNKAVR